MIERNLDYYLSLSYDLIIRTYVEKSEKEYSIHTNELDELAFYGVGNTVEKAISSFHETKKRLFEIYLERDIPIPTPNPSRMELHSGKFLVRTTPKIHGSLIKCAKENNQSLNAYVNAIFDQMCSYRDILKVARKEFSEMSKQLRSQETPKLDLKSKKLGKTSAKDVEKYSLKSLMQAA